MTGRWSPAPAGSTRRRPGWPSPARDGLLFGAGRRRAGRPRRSAGRRVAARPTVAEVLAAIEVDDEVGRARDRDRWPSARCRSDPTRPPTAVIPAVSSVGRPRTAPAGSPPSATATAAASRPAAAASRRRAGRAGRGAVGFTVRAAQPPEWWCDLVAAGRQAHHRRRALAQGRAGPRGGGHRRPRLRRAGVLAGCGPPTRAATCSRSTASSAPAPSCSCRDTATSSAPTRWPAPPRGAATRRPTPGWRPGCWRRPRTARSTRSPSTWSTTRCCRGARTSTTRPSRRWWRWPTSSTWPPLVEGRLSRAGAVGARAGGRPAPHAGGVRLARGTTALAFIAALERLDRGRYAGTVGWVDAPGNGIVGGRHPLRRDRRGHGPGVRRQRDRGRLRPGDRAGRDPRQAPGPDRRPSTAVKLRHSALRASPARPSATDEHFVGCSAWRLRNVPTKPRPFGLAGAAFGIRRALAGCSAWRLRSVRSPTRPRRG